MLGLFAVTLLSALSYLIFGYFKNSTEPSYLADVNGSLQTQALQAWYDLQNNIVTPDLCHSYAEQFSWETATDNLLEHLTLIDESLLSNAEQARSCYLSSFYKAFGSPIKIIAASAVIGILGWYIGKKPLV